MNPAFALASVSSLQAKLLVRFAKGNYAWTKICLREDISMRGRLRAIAVALAFFNRPCLLHFCAAMKDESLA
jgi:hypothetical protein